MAQLTFSQENMHYTLPTRENLPTGRVTWQPNRQHIALLLHDVQPYYFSALHPAVAYAALTNMRRLIDCCRANAIPIFISQNLPAKEVADRGLMYQFWGGGDTSSESTLAPELGLIKDEIRMIWKRSYSAFFATDFAVSLSRLHCQDLLVAGLYANKGCVATSLDAFMHDIRVFYIADAVADFSLDEHYMALRFVSQLCAQPLITDQVVYQFGREEDIFVDASELRTGL